MHIPGPKYRLRKDVPGKTDTGPGKMSDQQTRIVAEEEDPQQVGQEGDIPCMLRRPDI